MPINQRFSSCIFDDICFLKYIVIDKEMHDFFLLQCKMLGFESFGCIFVGQQFF